MIAPRVALLIDGGYFIRRLPRLVPQDQCDTPEHVVACIRRLCRNHVRALTGENNRRWQRHVHRTFYYDALPYDGKAHHPIDNRSIDFAKSIVATQRRELFDCLRRQRKMALRLGRVNREHDWAIKPELTKPLLRSRAALSVLDRLGPIPESGETAQTTLTLTAEECKNLMVMRNLWQSLDASCITLGLRQKGVDMRIGVDIASLALHKQVDTIVLVAGDSDFVPAAKLARRAGIDFILDPLWQKINADLFEHIDGLHSGLPRPGSSHRADTRPPQTVAEPAAEYAHAS